MIAKITKKEVLVEKKFLFLKQFLNILYISKKIKTRLNCRVFLALSVK